MTKWGRHLAGIVVVAVVTGACSSGSAPHARTETTVARVAAQASTTTAPRTTTTARTSSREPYSFDDSLAMPPLLNTGSDYPRIVESLMDYNDWLLSHHPDDALVANVDAPQSDAEHSTLHDLAILRKFDRRWFETTTAPDDVVVVSALSNAVSFRVTQHRTRESVVDRSGHLVSDVARSTTEYHVLITKMGGQWYLTNVDEVGVKR